MNIFDYVLFQTGSYTFTTGNVITLLVIFIASLMLRGLLHKIIIHQSKEKKITEEQSEMLSQIVSYVVFITAILLALHNIGIKLTVLLFGSAALLVGLGFGLQQLFQDLVSGLILLFDKNITVRDVIESEKFTGRIQRVGLRATRILTTDNTVVIIPNSHMIANNLVNLSHSRESARFRVKVGVSYGSNVEKIKEILYECALDHEMIEKHPRPQIFFTDFGESSLIFELRFWSKNIFFIETIQSDLRFMIDDRFRKNGVVIPFPQRDIHIKS